MNGINKILQSITGLPLTRTTRASNMECLKFGILFRTGRNGNNSNIGEFGLHLQCPWRFTNDTEIIVGSSDLFEQPNETAEFDENYNWDRPMENLRDVKLDKLIAENKIFVISALADEFGGLEICFDRDIRLTVFPNNSSKADHEYWRLLDNRNDNKKHYVITSKGCIFEEP